MSQATNSPRAQTALAVWALLYAVPFYVACCLAMFKARRGQRPRSALTLPLPAERQSHSRQMALWSP